MGRSLSAFDLCRPYLVVPTLLFLGLAFRKLYLNPQECRPDEPCAEPSTLHRQKRPLWIVTALALALLAAPTVLALFL
jgi:mercuric ion transport protein